MLREIESTIRLAMNMKVLYKMVVHPEGYVLGYLPQQIVKTCDYFTSESQRKISERVRTQNAQRCF